MSRSRFIARPAFAALRGTLARAANLLAQTAK